jgi:multiple sugar transport system permease protein
MSPEFEFRTFLENRYEDLDALNRAHAAEYLSFEHVPIPSLEVDYADFVANKDAIRWEFITANYVQVIDYIVLHGYSLFNTIVYCLLSILVSLTVNPIAAYALSRFRPPSSYKLLLFCMTTMAFPTAVTMIPSFLLVKNLGLLNTFWALVLPGMANGFSIFLLKGFFDSLPRELYESATIDGAGEWVMFWQLTMSLSKPILAVLALGAFTQAYGNFMFAFILCPDEKMWTLMVFLYNLQYRGHMGLTFAALLVAAIPTFLVFVFCQNIIIRGIVVPVEK